MSNIRVIKIEKGNEFGVINTGILKDALFFPAYEQALAQLKEIFPASLQKYTDEPISNIIAFCGERGEGKSSAMKTMAEAMRAASSVSNDEQVKNSKKFDEDFLDSLRHLSKTFKVLPTIDPTQMEMKSSILETVLSRLFLDFKNQWESLSTNDNRYHDALRYRSSMLEQFERCYKHIRTIKQEMPSDKISEMSFEDSLEELSRLGDSANLRKDLYNLIQCFLLYVSLFPHDFFWCMEYIGMQSILLLHIGEEPFP